MQQEAAMETMKAIQFHAFGGPEVLRLEQAPVPELGDHGLLVHVQAAGVNPVDAKLRGGAFGDGPLPQVAGLDFAGTVVEVGAGGAGFSVGDAVFGRTPLGHGGAYAEFVVVDAEDVARKPIGLDFVHAAAVPTAALAAWQALFDAKGSPTMNLKAGETVLIHGAAGGVGSFAVQLARWKGARVIATGRRETEGYLRALGAKAFIDHEREAFDDELRGVDAVLDLVGGETQTRSRVVLKGGGVLVTTVGLRPETIEAAALHDVRALAIVAGQDARILAEVGHLIELGVVSVRVSEALPLERAREAQEHIETGHTHGKIVLTVDDAAPAAGAVL
jgi:NADPH:quinone reductase-like Zn-dependent oxidoreductase